MDAMRCSPAAVRSHLVGRGLLAIALISYLGACSLGVRGPAPQARGPEMVANDGSCTESYSRPILDSVVGVGLLTMGIGGLLAPEPPPLPEPEPFDASECEGYCGPPLHGWDGLGELQRDVETVAIATTMAIGAIYAASAAHGYHQMARCRKAKALARTANAVPLRVAEAEQAPERAPEQADVAQSLRPLSTSGLRPRLSL